MRILQVHTAYLQPGGEDAVVAAEARLLGDGGHEVVVFGRRNPSSALRSAVALGRSARNRGAAAEIRDLIRNARPDVVHVHNTWFALSTSVIGAAHDAGIPVTMTLHNYRPHCIDSTLFREGATCTECLGTSPRPGVVHRCYRKSFVLSAIAAHAVSSSRRRGVWSDAVDCFIAPTSFARDLHVRGGLPEDRIVVKPHFAADPGPRPAPPSASDVVVAAGRLAPGKGTATLLEAWRRARPALRLEVLGDGPLRAELEAQAPADVQFLGHVPAPELHERLLAARAFVFPSEWPEPFGMVLIEAMAAGTAVVGSAVAGSTEIVEPSRPDLLVTPGDADALAGVLGLLVDDGLVDEAAGLGRERYLRAFTPETNLPLLTAAYERARARAR